MARDTSDQPPDLAALERAGAKPGARSVAMQPGYYLHVDAHPDHGEPVVFVGGEALPEWVVEAMAAEDPPGTADEHGIRRLTMPPKGRRRPPKERT